jgi:hypothetical protein
MFVKKVYAGGGKHKTPGSDDPGMKKLLKDSIGLRENRYEYCFL